MQKPSIETRIRRVMLKRQKWANRMFGPDASDTVEIALAAYKMGVRDKTNEGCKKCGFVRYTPHN